MQDRCMRISCARCLCQDLLSKTTCARSLYAILYDHLCKISVCGSLAQDLCARIFASGSCRTSCARSLYEDLLRKVLKISSAESCRSTCARPVYEDLLCKMSVSRSPKILQEHLSKISVCGSLVQDLSVMMFATRSCRTTCARSLYADLLCKISLSGCVHQDPVGPLVRDLCMKISCAMCLKISSAESCSSTCARSVYEDLLCMMSVSRSPQ